MSRRDSFTGQDETEFCKMSREASFFFALFHKKEDNFYEVNKYMDKIDLSYLSNPEIVGINLLDEHSSHRFFVNGKEPLLSLNGKWDFYRSSGWTDELLDYKTLAFRKCNLPRSAEMEVPEELIYSNSEYAWEGKEDLEPGEVNLKRDPVNVYRKNFSLKQLPKGKKQILRFEGFESAIYVYLNGHLVGYSTRLYVDSEFDLTPYLEEENELVVYNFRWSASSWMLDQDFWRFSGLFRDISIIGIGEIHLEDIDVKTDLVNNFKNGKLSINGSTNNVGVASISLCKGDKTLLNEEIKIEDNSFKLEKEIKNIAPWSAKEPNLYWLTIILKDENGNEETSSLEIGFSHQEIINGTVLWNGIPLLIKGVNRHEIDCHNGRATSLEDLLFDLKLLKKNNVNAIRCCHYPNDRKLYEYANRMGFFVMDECCIESHSRVFEGNYKDVSKYLPGSNPKWTKIALDRASSMYERDKNNVCIFSWSLGNESGGGNNLGKMADFFHEKDKKRLVHYEPEWFNPELTPYVDMRSYMYLPANKLEEYLISNPSKPVIECEYEHAMGNSCGNFDEYMRVFRKYPNSLGGFIWDYIDQGLYVDGKLVYGGDMNDVPNDLNFNCNGIVYSERKEGMRVSKMRTVKYMYSPLQITFEEDKIDLSLDSFYTHKDFVIYLEDYSNGNLISKEKIVWKGEKEINLPKKDIQSEHIRKIRVVNKVTKSEVLFDKPSSFAYQASEIKGEMQYITSHKYVGMRDDDLAFIFSKFGLETGLMGIELDGKEILASQARLTFYRPISDNDRGNLFAVKSSLYLGVSKWNAPVEIKDDRNGISLTYNVGDKGAKATITYSFKEGKYVDVEIHYYGVKGMPSLPCFGIDFPLKKNIKNFKFYGKGPLDSYSDRLEGESIGIYESSVENELLPYSIPQECGNHEETRFVELAINDEHSLLIEALDKPFSFKYLPNDEFEIDNANHEDELPASRKNHLTIYAAMRGIGGDDSWGADVHQKYQLSGEENYSLKFRVSVR